MKRALMTFTILLYSLLPAIAFAFNQETEVPACNIDTKEECIYNIETKEFRDCKDSC